MARHCMLHQEPIYKFHINPHNFLNKFQQTFSKSIENTNFSEIKQKH